MVCGVRGDGNVFDRECNALSWLDIEQERSHLIDRGAAVWSKVRHRHMADDKVAFYVVLFANNLLPLLAVSYVVRVLTPSGYDPGACAESFPGFIRKAGRCGSHRRT